MEVKVATHVGKVRENNEDAFWVGENYLVVCDGMGGHLAGEVASGLAIKTIQDFPFQGVDPKLELGQAINQAQENILQIAAAEPDYTGMGTTITLVWVTPLAEGGAKIAIGHVGDSRAYSFCNGVLTQLTLDHSVVGELIRAGSITIQEAKDHAKRHTITQALGSPEIEIELMEKTIPGGSFILLCTDGLTDVVEDHEISRILRDAGQSNNVAQELVDYANSLGGPDNITVIVAQLP